MRNRAHREDGLVDLADGRADQADGPVDRDQEDEEGARAKVSTGHKTGPPLRRTTNQRSAFRNSSRTASWNRGRSAVICWFSRVGCTRLVSRTT